MLAGSSSDWSARRKARWIDMAHTAEWLLDHAVVTPPEADTLLSLIGLLKSQGEDWDGAAR